MPTKTIASVGLALILAVLATTGANARCWNGETVSWYVDRHTASGEPYTYSESTCASRTLPFKTRVRVTDSRTGKSVVCRVNDRGPNQWTRCKIDVNEHAAQKLAMKGRGVIHAKIEVVKAGERKVVAHPAGCPHVAFCGCGTAKYLLGKVVTEDGLAVAANWLNFPRAACAPNMAAARHGHVFAIVRCLGDGKVLAYDPNGGHHRTYVHVRSLAGYTIVNPHGARYVSAG